MRHSCSMHFAIEICEMSNTCIYLLSALQSTLLLNCLIDAYAYMGFTEITTDIRWKYSGFYAFPACAISSYTHVHHPVRPFNRLFWLVFFFCVHSQPRGYSLLIFPRFMQMLSPLPINILSSFWYDGTMAMRKNQQEKCPHGRYNLGGDAPFVPVAERERDKATRDPIDR